MSTRTPTADELRGVWILESVQTPLTDGGTQHPFGDQPVGTIIYLANGVMAVHIAGSDHTANKLLAYAGRWRIAGDRVVHDVEESLDISLRGVRLERRAEFDPVTGTLTYTTVEAQGPGCPVVRWHKAP